VKKLGDGAFGIALLVKSIIDKKLYAMKVIRIDKMDKKQKKDSLNEVQVLRAMMHPNIITYRESFMDKGTPKFL